MSGQTGQNMLKNAILFSLTGPTDGEPLSAKSSPPKSPHHPSLQVCPKLSFGCPNSVMSTTWASNHHQLSRPSLGIHHSSLKYKKEEHYSIVFFMCIFIHYFHYFSKWHILYYLDYFLSHYLCIQTLYCIYHTRGYTD